MNSRDNPILIYSTFPSKDEAIRVGRVLVEEQLAACVNIFEPMTAIYRWQGNLEEAGEAAMLIKTRANLEARVLAQVERLHPYEKPALLVLDVSGGSNDYIAWIFEQTQGSAALSGK